MSEDRGGEVVLLSDDGRRVLRTFKFACGGDVVVASALAAGVREAVANEIEAARLAGRGEQNYAPGHDIYNSAIDLAADIARGSRNVEEPK